MLLHHKKNFTTSKSIHVCIIYITCVVWFTLGLTPTWIPQHPSEFTASQVNADVVQDDLFLFLLAEAAFPPRPCPVSDGVRHTIDSQCVRSYVLRWQLLGIHRKVSTIIGTLRIGRNNRGVLYGVDVSRCAVGYCTAIAFFDVAVCNAVTRGILRVTYVWWGLSSPCSFYMYMGRLCCWWCPVPVWQFVHLHDGL